MYPTKEEILQALYLPTQKEIKEIILWKKSYYKGWSTRTTEEKHKALTFLLNTLCQVHKTITPNYQAKKNYEWTYITTDPPIITAPSNNPSIISLLHELGHHLFGHSELEACRYSIGIFKECFNKSYNQLIWEGHTLRKRT